MVLGYGNRFHPVDRERSMLQTMRHRLKKTMRRGRKRRAQRRWKVPFERRRDRAVAWLHMIFADVGYFRLIYNNEHRVTDKVRRSAQPTPFTIRRWARQGVRTVVNLRGSHFFGTRPLEMEACMKAGIAYEEFPLYSRKAPTHEIIVGLRDLFQRIEYPAVLHCHAGADRAGLAAAIYLVMMAGRPVDEAMQQLSLRYGHLKAHRTGVLGAVLREYHKAQQASGVDLIEWSRSGYDPAAFTAAFRSNRWSRLVGDVILRRE